MAAVDPAILQKLHVDLGADPLVTCELIDTFLGEAPKLLALMRTGISTGPRSELNRAAHSLKSTAATFGAMRLSQLCRALEEASEKVVPEDAAARAAAIEAEWARVRVELRALRPSPPA